MSATDILGIILGLGVLLFALAVGGLMVSALVSRPKADELEQQRRRAVLDQERERAAAREAEQQLHYLSDWASERGYQRINRDQQGGGPRA